MTQRKVHILKSGLPSAYVLTELLWLYGLDQAGQSGYSHRMETAATGTLIALMRDGTCVRTPCLSPYQTSWRSTLTSLAGFCMSTAESERYYMPSSNRFDRDRAAVNRSVSQTRTIMPLSRSL